MKHPLRFLAVALLLFAVAVPLAHAQRTPGAAAAGPTLSHAYPNPFASATAFELRLDRARAVRVEVFNVLGQRVATLHEGRLAAGTPHRFTFEGDDLPPGIYLLRATGDDLSLTRRVVYAP